MGITYLKKEFEDSQISKIDFISRMHEYHKVLFDFSHNLSKTEIGKIEINDNEVIFSTRKTEFHPGGVKFYVDGLDKRITPIEAFNFNQYELADSAMLYKLVKDGDIIFDIGANIGWYSNHLSKKLPNATIHSFEPIPETFLQLTRNTALNQSKNIFLHNTALSDKIQTLVFYYSPKVTGASSSVNITEDESMVELACETNTLDAFCSAQNIQMLDFIKCDVEGGEWLVFKGGAKTISQLKPIVFTEMLRKWSAKFGYHPNDIIAFFKSLDYSCFYAHNGKLRKIETVTDETSETNFFFLSDSPAHLAIIENHS